RNEVWAAKKTIQEMMTQMMTVYSITVSRIRKASKNTASAPISPPRPEDRAPDAHHRRSLFDRDLEVLAHPHREMRQADSIADLAKPSEIFAGVADRRNRHQSHELQAAHRSNLAHHRLDFARLDAALLRLVADVDLQQHVPRRLARARNFLR